MIYSLVIDIIIALVGLIIILKSTMRGFIKSFMSFARSILAILLAFLFHAPLAKVFSSKIFINTSCKWVSDAFLSTDNGDGTYNLYTLFEGVPKWFTDFALKSGADKEVLDTYFNAHNPAPVEVVDSLTQSLGEQVSLLISRVVAFVVIFLVTEIVLFIVGILFNKMSKVPVLNFINCALGAVIGIAIFVFAASLIAFFVTWILDFGMHYRPDIFSYEVVDSSLILKFFAEHNIWKVIGTWISETKLWQGIK